MTTFGLALRQHRKAASLTQEALAARAHLSTHAISDLEREITQAPHAQTVKLLADALNLTGTQRTEFEGAARRHRASDPQSWMSLVVTKLDEDSVDAARAALEQWRRSGSDDGARLAWAAELIELAAAGRLQPPARRLIPAAAPVRLVGREQQEAELSAFLDRVERGRGGLALVMGAAGIGKSSLLAHVLSGRSGAVHAEWMTFDRGESGYQGWRRLLAPMWIQVRRAEIAPASLFAHREALDDVLLVGSDAELAGRHFSGEVATAFAALVTHAASHRPLVLVIDDAQRGGLSSDQLFIAVARRVSHYGAGVVAALRPDELEADSPLCRYDADSGGQAATDVVTPIRVPPLDAAAAGELLRERAGAEPPLRIVEQVLRQTGGRPQLIQNIEIHAPPGQAPADRSAASQPAGAWSVGKLRAAGLRVLNSTVRSRPEAARGILQVAAISAADGRIEPEVIARLADLPGDVVEVVLDEERRLGVILAPDVPDYRFEHDNWIDSLVSSCPAVQRRLIHSRCLALLRGDPSADPRLLARHAIGAGPALVGEKDIIDWATQAADLNVADYAFGAAAELYREAARLAAGDERIDLLIRQADACRPDGRWDEAREALKLAASLARKLDLPGREAIAIMHLERLTWSYGLRELDLTQQIRDVIQRIPADQAVLRAQAQAALATRLSIATRQHENEQADIARAVERQLPAVLAASDREARADIILGIRHGLQDHAAPEVLLGYDRELLDLGIEMRSPFHISEALTSRIIDLIRAARIREIPSAVRALREFADQISAPYVWYAVALVEAMFALARGDFDVAQAQTDVAAGLSAQWGDSMAGEALMAQAGWRLFELGEIDGLAGLLTALPTTDVSSQNEIVWELGKGLILAEMGDAGPAIQVLRDVCAATGDFTQVSRGPSRSGILATGATLLGHPAVLDALPGADAARWGGSLVRVLTGHPDPFMLAGWPAVILGSKNRHIGLASLAAGRLAPAAAHLTRAVEENAGFPVLHARALFDLGRTARRQPAGGERGIEMLDRVARMAADLKMTGLAAQARAAARGD